MTTEERLGRLERELSWAKTGNRWLMVGTVLLVGGLCVAWVEAGAVMAAQTQQDTAEEIRANRFVLVDDAGRTRATLGMREGEPDLRLMDEVGAERVILGVTTEFGSAVHYNTSSSGERTGYLPGSAARRDPQLRIERSSL